MSAPAVVFSHTVKGFVQHVLERRKLLSPEVIERLARHGVDVKRPKDVAIAEWWKALDYARGLVAAERTDDEGWEFLGGEVVRGFADTLVGRSAFLVLKVMGPRRALRQLTEQYRGADSVTKVDSRELTPTSVELIYTVVGGIQHPTYIRGVLLVGMQLVGAKAPQVDIEHLPTLDAYRFVVRWSD